MRNPMPAAHERGQEATRQLVLALCTWLEMRQAFAQAVIDALVVAGLEMETGDLFNGAPVAAIQGIGTAQAQRAGDGFTLALSQEQHQCARRRLRQLP